MLEVHGVLELEFPGSLGQVEQVLVQDSLDQPSLLAVHLVHADTFVGHDAVVAVRAAEMALVVLVPSTLGHGGIVHEFVRLCALLQVLRQGSHEFETQVFFAGQDAGALVGAGVDFVGLGAGEPGTQNQLAAVEEGVQAEMVAVEGPAPWTVRGGVAEEDEVVRIFVHDLRGFDELAEEVVDAHRRDGLFVTFWRERRLEHGENRVAEGWRELVEAQALVAEQEFRVRPGPPFG